MTREERAQAVYAILSRAAKAGKPCPTNMQIGSAIGTGDSSACKAITDLAKSGRIALKYQRGNNLRVVTIQETGHRTAESSVSVVKGVPYVQAAPSDKFSARMRDVGGRFEDHPSACRPMPRFRTLPPPTEVLRESCIGLAGTAQRGGVRTR
jgi:hypothetical protein